MGPLGLSSSLLWALAAIMDGFKVGSLELALVSAHWDWTDPDT